MENNLRAVVNKIEQAVRSVDYNMGSFFYGDIYNINHLQEVKYPAVIVTNSTHTSKSDYITYNFNIFYVDRLTADKSNKLDVQSMATISLNNALQVLDEGYIVNDNWEIHTFEEKFNDVCAGAYINVGIQCPIELCNVELPEIISNLEDISISKNGTYTAPYGTAYKNIDVDVPKDINLAKLSETYNENGSYSIDIPEGYDGIENVEVKVEVEPKISEEYYRKLITGHLDEPLIIPEGTTNIPRNKFNYLNYGNEEICPLCNIPEGVTNMDHGTFQFAKIKKIITPSTCNCSTSNVFSNNTDLEELIINCKQKFYSGNMCQNCSNLKRVIYRTLYIAGISFSNCVNLELVDFSNCTGVPILANVNAFTNVPTSCEIRVPAALYDTWIKATNWSTLYAQGYNFIAV